MQPNKIVTISQLIEQITPELVKDGESLVLCHGHYNIIHPGHLRFSHHTKSLGNKLIVAVYGDSYFSELEFKKMYPQQIRADALSALEMVDYVLILDDVTLQETLDSIKPDIFVMGKDYEQEKTEEEEEASKFAKSSGIRVVYHSGDINYASSELLHSSYQELEKVRIKQFVNSCKRQQVKISNLLHYLEQFKKRRIY